MAFYVVSADRPFESGIANEDVKVGELVKHTSNGVELVDGTEGSANKVGGVADNPDTGDQIVADPRDTGGQTYKSSENDRVPFGGFEDGAIIKVRTIKDDGDDNKPSISDGNVVGVLDTSTSSSAGSHAGRVVEDGYTDEDANTYNTSSTNNDLIPIGEAHRDSASDFDVILNVKVDKSLELGN